MVQSILGGNLTDIAGRQLYYGEDAQIPNSGGVLATSPWANHKVGGYNLLTNKM